MPNVPSALQLVDDLLLLLACAAILALAKQLSAQLRSLADAVPVCTLDHAVQGMLAIIAGSHMM
eukprot:11428863-Alexandrium_andersonii.AAC.1